MGGSIVAGGGGGGETEGGVGTRSGYQGDTPPGVGYRSDPGVPLYVTLHQPPAPRDWCHLTRALHRDPGTPTRSELVRPISVLHAEKIPPFSRTFTIKRPLFLRKR